MGLKGSDRDWRALVLEMKADGITEENIEKLMSSFENTGVTPRKAVSIYRSAIDKHYKEAAKEEKNAARDAKIPRPDSFGNWA